MKRRAWCWIVIALASLPCAAQSTGPAPEPATEPASQPTTAPATEPTTEPTTLPATELTTEPTTEPATQPATEPSTEPTTEPSTESTTQATTEPTTQPTTSPSTQPTTQPAPPIPLSGLPEGVLFLDHVGQLANKPKSREIDFIFEKDGKLSYVPVLPNLELMRMENAIGEADAKLSFHAAGRITEYKGRNYLLIDHASLAEQSTTEPSPVR